MNIWVCINQLFTMITKTAVNGSERTRYISKHQTNVWLLHGFASSLVEISASFNRIDFLVTRYKLSSKILFECKIFREKPEDGTWLQRGPCVNTTSKSALKRYCSAHVSHFLFFKVSPESARRTFPNSNRFKSLMGVFFTLSVWLFLQYCFIVIYWPYCSCQDFIVLTTLC